MSIWLPRSLALVLLGLIALAAPVAATAKPPRETITPLAAKVLAPPRPVLGTDGKRHLVYELQLYNWTGRPQMLESVTVRSGSGRVVRRYLGSSIDPLLVQQPYGSPEPADRVLAPNDSTILWFDIALRPQANPPARLTHLIRVNGVRSPLGPTRVGDGAIVVSPPLRGKRFFNLNGCCGADPHNRAIQTLDGVRWLSQRYAIDFVQIDPTGSSYKGDPNKADSYYIFKKPVYAVAPGKITSVVDSRPNNVPPSPDPTLNNYNSNRFVTGNHVIEKLGPHLYAMYAHLTPNSVKVKVGQRVRRGQRLASVGNSGNSSAPHLHFQLMSRNSPLGSNSIPYVFDHFDLAGRVTGSLLEVDETGGGPFVRNRSARRNQLPLSATVLDFP